MNNKYRRYISSNVWSLHFSWEQEQSRGYIFFLRSGANMAKLNHMWPGLWRNDVQLSSFASPDQAQLIQMVVWMLQRRLLTQLHTYVCLLVPPSEDEPGSRDEDPPLAARVGGRSLSTPSALSFGSPSMSSLSAFRIQLLELKQANSLSLNFPNFALCSQQRWHDPHKSQHGQLQCWASARWRLSSQQEDYGDAARQSVGAREAAYSQHPRCTKSRRSQDVRQVIKLTAEAQRVCCDLLAH